MNICDKSVLTLNVLNIIFPLSSSHWYWWWYKRSVPPCFKSWWISDQYYTSDCQFQSPGSLTFSVPILSWMYFMLLLMSHWDIKAKVCSSLLFSVTCSLYFLPNLTIFSRPKWECTSSVTRALLPGLATNSSHIYHVWKHCWWTACGVTKKRCVI